MRALNHRSNLVPAYIQLDPRFTKAGNAAIGLWTMALAWSTANRADGTITKDAVRELGTDMQAKRLVKARLWNETPDGYEFASVDGIHVYDPTSDDVVAARAASAQRMRATRARRKAIADGTAGSLTV